MCIHCIFFHIVLTDKRFLLMSCSATTLTLHPCHPSHTSHCVTHALGKFPFSFSFYTVPKHCKWSFLLFCIVCLFKINVYLIRSLIVHQIWKINGSCLQDWTVISIQSCLSTNLVAFELGLLCFLIIFYTTVKLHTHTHKICS